MTPFRHESIFSVSKVLSLALLTAVGCRIRKGDKRTCSTCRATRFISSSAHITLLFLLMSKSLLFSFQVDPKDLFICICFGQKIKQPFSYIPFSISASLLLQKHAPKVNNAFKYLLD